jgi:hypothetical protein
MLVLYKEIVKKNCSLPKDKLGEVGQQTAWNCYINGFSLGQIHMDRNKPI